MISMFMGNEDRLHFSHIQVPLLHSSLGFPATQARIHKDRFISVTDIVTIGITA